MKANVLKHEDRAIVQVLEQALAAVIERTMSVVFSYVEKLGIEFEELRSELKASSHQAQDIRHSSVSERCSSAESIVCSAHASSSSRWS